MVYYVGIQTKNCHKQQVSRTVDAVLRPKRPSSSVEICFEDTIYQMKIMKALSALEAEQSPTSALLMTLMA